MRLDFQTPAFKALTTIVERLTSRKVTISTVYFEWTAPVGQVKVPNNDVEGLLHEFCHWLVAQRSLRDNKNHGLKNEECLSKDSSSQAAPVERRNTMKKPNGKDCLLIEGPCSCGAWHDKAEVPIDGGEAFRKWRGNVFTTDPPNTPPPPSALV